VTPLTGADVYVKDDYSLGIRFLRKANGNEDARVYEYAAHNAATATSSKSVLGYLAMSKLLVGAERDSEHPSATVTPSATDSDSDESWLGLKRLPVDQAGPLSGGCKPRPNVKPPGTGKFRGNPGPARGPAGPTK
jgi:hypothetical protein